MAGNAWTSEVTVDLNWNLSTPWGTPLKGTGDDARKSWQKLVENPLSPSTDADVAEINQWPTLVDEAEGMKESIEQTGEDLEKIKNDREAQIEEEEKADLDRIDTRTEEDQTLIKETAEKQQAIEDEQRKRIEKEQADALELLKEKEKIALSNQETEKAKLNAEAELAKRKNEQLIVQTQAKVEIERQQSAWAYQKLGLGFSDGIIKQSQQIATDGITEIANIKAQMNYNQAMLGIEKTKIVNEMANIELEYANDINNLISAYSDKTDELDKNTIDRLASVQANLLTSNREKEDAYQKILNENRDEKTALERQHIEDMQIIKEKGYEYSKEINSLLEAEKEVASNKISMSIEMWGWFGKSQAEKDKMLIEAWMSPSDWVAMEKKMINKSITNSISSVMPEGYIPDEKNYLSIKNRTNELISMGYTMEEAVNKSTKEIMSKTDEFKTAKEISNLKDKVTLKQLKDSLAPSSSSPSIIDKVYNKDGERVYVYSDWSERKIVETLSDWSRRILWKEVKSGTYDENTQAILNALTWWETEEVDPLYNEEILNEVTWNSQTFIDADDMEFSWAWSTR